MNLKVGKFIPMFREGFDLGKFDKLEIKFLKINENKYDVWELDSFSKVTKKVYKLFNYIFTFLFVSG